MKTLICSTIFTGSRISWVQICWSYLWDWRW